MSHRTDERGVVDDALDASGSRRTVVLTTPRFLAAPYSVARVPVLAAVHARVARIFAVELGLSPPSVELRDVAVSLLWYDSYDHDPVHAGLRRIVVKMVHAL